MNMQIGPPPATPPRDRYPELVELLKTPKSKQEIEREIDEYRRQIQAVLFNPLDAFTAAWRYACGLFFCDNSMAPDGSLIKSAKWCEMTLSGALASQCKSPGMDGMAWLRGKRADALHEFMTTIGILLDTWLEFREQDEPDIRWTVAYPDLAREMQRAQQARIMWTQSPNWLVKGTMDKPKLIGVQKIRGQRTFGQAAKTAAYILWGDFLFDNPQSIDFCEVCFCPFKARSNKRFFPASCGNRKSANKAHKSDVRKENWKKLKMASLKLSQRLGKQYRGKILTGLASGRWLARFIRAAEDPEDTQARKTLFELCVDYDSSETRLSEVRAVFNRFLDDIVKAQATGHTDA